MGNYAIVSVSFPNEIERITNVQNPKRAIEEWSRMVVKNPCGVSIVCKSKSAIQLLDWCKQHKSELIDIFNKYGVGKVYELDYIFKGIENSNGVDTKYDEYGGDQVYPFSLG